MRKINVCIAALCVIGVFALLMSIKPISVAVSNGLDVLVTEQLMDSYSD